MSNQPEIQPAPQPDLKSDRRPDTSPPEAAGDLADPLVAWPMMAGSGLLAWSKLANVMAEQNMNLWISLMDCAMPHMHHAHDQFQLPEQLASSEHPALFA